MLWALLDFDPASADLLAAQPGALSRLASLVSASTLPPFREDFFDEVRDGRDVQQEMVQCAVGMWWGCSSRVSRGLVRSALQAGIGDAVHTLLGSGEAAESSAKARFCAGGLLAAWFVVAPAEMGELWGRAKGEAVSVVKAAMDCLLAGAGRRVAACPFACRRHACCPFLLAHCCADHRRQ